MTQPIVLQDNEISLGGYHLPIKGPVHITSVDHFPGKVTIGATRRSDEVVADEWVMDDWRGGMLVENMDVQAETDRWWMSYEIDTLRKRQMILGPAAQFMQPGLTDLDPVGTGGGNPDLMFAFQNVLVVTWGRKFFYWDGTNWSALKFTSTLGGASTTFTDAIIFQNVALVAASGGAGYVKIVLVTDGAQYYDETIIKPKFFTLFDANSSQKVMAVDATTTANANTLYALTTIVLGAGADTWDSTIGGQLFDKTVNSMVTFRNVNDEPTIFLGCTDGLYSVDVWTKTVYKTSLNILENPDGGKGMCVWSDGNLYFPDGTAIWKYPKIGQIVNVGMDRSGNLDTNQGLPINDDVNPIRGRIIKLIPHPNFLYAILDGSLSRPSGTINWIMVYNGSGWHTHTHISSNTAYKANCLTTIFNNKRQIFVGRNNKVTYFITPEGAYNPLNDPLSYYASHGSFKTSFFDAGYSEILKLATSIKIKTKGITSTKTIAVEYITNSDDTNASYISLGTINNLTIDSKGYATFYFPSSTSRAGIQFYNIRLRFVFDTNDQLVTPVLEFFNLRFKKIPDSIYSYTFQVTSENSIPSSVGIKDTWRALRDLKSAKLLVQFAFMSDDEGITNRWVEIVNLSGVRAAGKNKYLSFTCTVIELEPSS